MIHIHIHALYLYTESSVKNVLCVKHYMFYIYMCFRPVILPLIIVYSYLMSIIIVIKVNMFKEVYVCNNAYQEVTHSVRIFVMY